MTSSIGTAWIQVKPSLSGVSSDIEKELGKSGGAASTTFGNQFKSNFLSSAKASFSQGFSEFTSRSRDAFSGFVSSAKIAGLAATGFLIAGLKQFIDAASNLQSLRSSFESLTGSAVAANKVMQSLYAYGKETAFSNDQINQTARLFLGAGTSANALLGIMQKVGDLAGSTGADLEGLALPISQAFAAGKLQTQDWYQVLNQGGGVLKKYIIQALGAGHTTKTFADDLSSGAINAGVLNKALTLADKVGGAAFNGAIKQANTFNGRMSNLQEAITNVGLSILGVDSQTGEVDPSGIFAKLSDAVADATDWLTENKQAINDFVTSLIESGKKIATWIGEHKELVKNVLIGIAAFKTLQITTGAVVSAFETLRPYGKILQGTFQLAVGGVQALIAKFKGVEEVQKISQKTSDGIDQISTSVKKAPKSFTFGDSVYSFFKNIGQVLSGGVKAILSPLQTLAGGISQILKTVLTGAGQALAGFFGALSNPALLTGVVVFAAAAGGVALSILAIGSAVGVVSPGLANFLNNVIIPLGTFLLGSFVVALDAVTGAMTSLTVKAVIPLVRAVSGGLTQAFSAVGGVIKDSGNAISGVVDSIANGIAKVINSVANLLKSVGKQNWYSTGYGITRNFSAGIIDGLIDFLQDSLNDIIDNLLNIPGIGTALKAVGIKKNPVNLSSFKLGKRAEGGPVFGAGSSTSDSIPMALSNGEYVVRTAAAQKIGYNNLDRLNSTGEIGSTYQFGDIIIQGYNKDPRELADEFSKEISLRKARVIG